jgi:hypothetical protein
MGKVQLSCESKFETSLTGAGIAAVCLENANWWQNNRIMSEVFEAMDHSILSHRGSQHRSQKANLNQFNDRRSATKNPNFLMDGSQQTSRKGGFLHLQAINT